MADKCECSTVVNGQTKSADQKKIDFDWQRFKLLNFTDLSLKKFIKKCYPKVNRAVGHFAKKKILMHLLSSTERKMNMITRTLLNVHLYAHRHGFLFIWMHIT